MREFFLPIIGGSLIALGVIIVLLSISLARVAFVLEGAGVLLLGIYLGINFWRRRPRKRQPRR